MAVVFKGGAPRAEKRRIFAFEKFYSKTELISFMAFINKTLAGTRLLLLGKIFLQSHLLHDLKTRITKGSCQFLTLAISNAASGTTCCSARSQHLHPFDLLLYFQSAIFLHPAVEVQYRFRSVLNISYKTILTVR
jgi:hypothetical protein